MKRVFKLNKKKGILFWITGLSGSGKSSIAKEIWPTVKKIYGPKNCFKKKISAFFQKFIFWVKKLFLVKNFLWVKTFCRVKKIG